MSTQVGYISEYPHALAPGAAVSAPAAGVPPLDAVFWEGRRVELGGGREVIGQVWPSVRARPSSLERRFERLC